ncbi:MULTISPECIES: TonB-dependent receptor domain-containing protein [Sphingomonas]|uniref:TonB-dependent receptor domain-containing protein n=1 Tax=Sphingomonas TaxID=13687 RepID=UPI0009E6842C|nr:MULTISPECIES: TonB-dependent receptor [Sphingomonas]MDY0967171.1 TonB-dependent receptor [Sphingomonas sp. CFBP9021]USQ99108.1 TonB-dependent receptor [Sphingomonas aerolata]
MNVRNSASYVALAGALMVSATPAIGQVTPAQAEATTPAEAKVEADAATATSAVDAPPAEDRAGGGDIVVTGSRIQRPNMTSAAPITSVTSQDIRAQAAVNVEDVLNRLPQVAPDSQQTYNDSDGRQRIKLRSLGFERTLVLIDGKRLGTQNGQDVGIIPPSLLERVDVLTGGASSVYGSDAVAGVVNFVLKKDFEGIQLDGNYNFYNHNNKDTVVSSLARAAGFNSPRGLTNDGGRADVTLTAGKKFFDGALRINGFVNYKHTDEVLLSERSNSGCYLTQTSLNAPISCGLTPSSSTSGLISPLDSKGVATGQYVNNPNGTRTFVPFGTGAGNASNYFSNYAYQRPSERVNAGGFVSLDVAPDAEVYASGIWFRDKSYNNYPAIAGGNVQVNCNNPFLSASQASTICGAAAGTAAFAPIDIRYRLGEGNDQPDSYLNTGLRLTGGLRGKAGDAWTYDIGGVYARNKQDYTPSFVNAANLRNSLNVGGTLAAPTCAGTTDAACVPFDAFSAGNTNPALIDYLYDRGTSTTIGTLYDVQANITGDLGKYGVTSPFAEQGVAIALGTEYRKDTLKSTADSVYRAGLGGNDTYLKQDVWEANIEVQAPLIEHKPFAELLQANGGYRVSKYSSNSSSFNTWKIEGIYAPVSDLTFRASFNKAQRAPTVTEIRQATNVDFARGGSGTFNDFCAPTVTTNAAGGVTYGTPVASREVCRATGLSDALYGSPTLICPGDASTGATGCTVRSGGFEADPETAYTQTYGLIVKPRFVPGLVFSVDRYKIKIDDSLGYNDFSYYTDGCQRSNGDAFFCQGIVRNPGTGTLYSDAASNPTTGFIRQGTTNFYKSIARGYDFQAQYTLDLASVGKIDWNFNGSLTTFAGGQDSPVQPTRNCAGYYGNGCGQLIPKWSHGLRATYTTVDKGFSASFNWRYVGSLTNADNSGDPAIGGTPERERTSYFRVSPKSYFDLALNFAIDKAFSLRLIANNLLDKSAPIVPDSYNVALARTNTIPQRYDSLGRNLAVGATVRF